MNKELNHIDFLDLIPSSIAGDETIRAAARALNDDLNRISRETANLILFARIDKLTEPVLSHLAWQFKVEFWEDDLTLAEKRGLIKESIAWHKIKGTPAAVERIGRIVFGSMDLVEWPEYGGIPTHFKIKTGDIVQSAEFYTRLFDLVDIAKNARSFLESVIITKEKNNSVCVGGVVRLSRKITLIPYSEISAKEGTARLGGVVRIGNKIKVKSFTLNMEMGQATAVISGVVRTVRKYQIKGAF